MESGNNLIKCLKIGGVAVIPTDTLYGIVGQALNRKTVERIKKIKVRPENKPFIVLVSSVRDLKKLKIDLNLKEKEILKRFWPGPVSIILSCRDKKFSYLSKNGKIAVRWPKNKSLENIIKETGPLVAPSANPSETSPAKTIAEAKKHFGSKIDFYSKSKKHLDGPPSTIISIENGKFKVLREGKIKILK